MVGVDAGVDHIGASACAGSVVVLVRSRSRLATRQTSQTPRSTGLGRCSEGRDSTVLLDVFDLWG